MSDAGAPHGGMTLFDFESQERQALHRNHGSAGGYFHFAEASTAIFAATVTGADRSRVLFMASYSMVRKHLILAVLSALRQHKVQSALNLRQAIEGGVIMAYLIANPDPVQPTQDLAEVVVDNRFAERLNGKARKWLNASYPERSQALKEFKDDINQTDSHSNIVNSYATFDFESVERGFSENLYLDRQDDDITKIALWNIGHIANHITGVLVHVARDHRGVEIASDIDEKLAFLARLDQALLAEMQAKPRWAEHISNERASS